MSFAGAQIKTEILISNKFLMLLGVDFCYTNTTTMFSYYHSLLIYNANFYHICITWADNASLRLVYFTGGIFVKLFTISDDIV